MTYSLAFKESALKEWRKLQEPIRLQFKAKLNERLRTPRVPASPLHGMPDCYKIKLKASGYRLVYRVIDRIVTVEVIAVGKRDKSAVYFVAGKRLKE
jgi:mRNA interferase RelE/StbE